VLIPAQITPVEKELLIDWYRQGVSPLIRGKAQTVLMNSQGLSAKKISQLVFRDYKTVRTWLVAFKKQRLASLFSQHRDNHNASKLTPTQKHQIALVLSQPPSDYGIPKQFWQVRDLKKWIKAEFGVVYESDRSYHFLFRLSRFSWHLPDRFDVKRDSQLIEAKIKQIRQEIKPLLDDSAWAVLAGDETRLVWESQSRRAWLKTNQKTVIKVHRSNDYQSFLGSLDLKTGQCHLHSLDWQNQEEVIKALRKLKQQYPGKRICLVWDNAPAHRSKLIRQKLKKHHCLSNFHLIAFPPYAPDTNPVEHIWKYAKDRIAHRETISFRQKLNHFKLAVIHRKFHYQI
jgi:transposase